MKMGKLLLSHWLLTANSTLSPLVRICVLAVWKRAVRLPVSIPSMILESRLTESESKDNEKSHTLYCPYAIFEEI